MFDVVLNLNDNGLKQNEDQMKATGHANSRIEGMDSLLFTVALEVTLQQMKIVDGCAALQASQNPALEDTPLRLQRTKLLNDRQFVTDIIRASVIEMANAGAYNSLHNAICILKERETEFKMLRLEYQRLRSSQSTICDEIKLKREQFKEDLHLAADRKITLLADNKEDQKVNARIRLVYADKWLNAAAEVLEVQNSISPARVPSTEHENRVHEELIKAYDLQIKERQESVENWRLKYSDDTAKMNLQVAEKREQLRVAVIRREELQKLYNLHEGEMRSWLTFKRERAARLARVERARLAAVHIQAWWRGEMVRRGLGAFKHLRNAKKLPSKNKKK